MHEKRVASDKSFIGIICQFRFDSYVQRSNEDRFRCKAGGLIGGGETEQCFPVGNTIIYCRRYVDGFESGPTVIAKKRQKVGFCDGWM